MAITALSVTANSQGQDIKEMKGRFDGIDNRLDGMDRRFDGIDTHHASQDEKLNQILERLPKQGGES